MAEQSSVVMRMVFAIAFGYVGFAAGTAVVAPSLTYSGQTGVVGILSGWGVTTVVAFVTISYGERVLRGSDRPVAREIDISYAVAEIGIIFGVASNLVYWSPEVLGQGGHPSVVTALLAGISAAVVGKVVLLYRGHRSRATGR